MSSRCRDAAALAFVCALAAAPVAARELRVCADPDNPPFSRADGSGFENRIATLVASELHADLRYYWLPDRRGFARKTLGAGHCDVIVGVPTPAGHLLTTAPYYRGAYMFVYRSRWLRRLTSFDDPRLRSLRIGVALVGNDLAATPPVHALARRGIVANVVGFPVAGARPVAERMMEALGEGKLDVAVVWGPQTGYFARRAVTPIALTAVPADGTGPVEFDIGMGVRRDDRALRDDLDGALDRARPAIDAVLAEYAVPRADRQRARAR